MLLAHLSKSSKLYIIKIIFNIWRDYFIIYKTLSFPYIKVVFMILFIYDVCFSKFITRYCYIIDYFIQSGLMDRLT